MNSANFVSLPGAFEHVFGRIGGLAGWLIAIAAVATLLGLWWLERTAPGPAVYAMTAAVAVLALPQPLFYEAGLLALLAGVVIARRPKAAAAVGVAAAATWLQAASGSLGSLPLTLLVLAATLGAGAVLRPQRPARELAA